ncbi:PfkB family carbohydrate kinase [Nakamurella leprariae]|uniref:SIS domain-containing protein n=1 Tax=Nakamurella leprariae TaxID=2803911 RepID=A0A938YBE4_9ACTN|nr:PfkB family carbohydrate kinase [Nakamurella leprariae]MBM9469380.1 SIS domain-containing protein [Nakamurella leprariae]
MTAQVHDTQAWLAAHADELAGALADLTRAADRVADWARQLDAVYARHGRVLVAGNGGSAAEAQHLTSELVGRFLDERRPLSAICLSAETSALTAIVNDYGATEMFARQVQAHGRPGDVLILLSTSGRSPNVLEAARRARQLGLRIWALTGPGPNPLAELCDEALPIAATSTAGIQTGHLVVIHALCAALDAHLTGTAAPEPEAHVRQPVPTAPAGTAVAEPVPADDRPGPSVVVIGDVVLDRDVHGRTTRISPDAPVPVVDVQQTRVSPGGAGLTALQVAAAGAATTLIAPLADDADGRALVEQLTAAGVRVVALPHQGGTRSKTRIRSAGQSLVRVDTGGPGTPGDVSEALAREVAAALAGAATVLVSDYGAGTTTHPVIRDLLTRAASRGRMVWDPHPRSGPPVPGCLLVTPNAAEARGLLGEAGTDTAARQLPADVLADRLVQKLGVRGVSVTAGARGAFLAAVGSAARYLPAPAASGGDPCGAGDQFAASAAVALARGALPSEAVQRAVHDASAWVAAGGAEAFRVRSATGPAASGSTEVPVVAVGSGDSDVHRLLAGIHARGGTLVATGGCFDIVHPGHVATLQAARRLGDALVVVINSDESVRRLKGPTRPVVPEQDRARVLSAFDCVDAVVIFDEDDPRAVLDWIRPQVWVKGGDYGGTPLPETDVVERHGGRVVLLPYLDGRSTTAILARSAAGSGAGSGGSDGFGDGASA